MDCGKRVTHRGLVAALLPSHALASFMFGISVRDPRVLTSSVLALRAVASAASLFLPFELRGLNRYGHRVQ
jgi:hypothetical protein